VDLTAVLAPLSRGRFDPTMRVDPTGTFGPAGTWRTFRTPVGASTMHLAQRSDGDVVARAWGPGAEWTVANLPGMLGDADDWSDLDVSSVPLLAETLRRRPGLRLPRVGLVLEMMIASIIEQRITSLEARASWRALVSRHGEAAPGPAPEGMRVFPDPVTWIRIPSWEWHRAGVDPSRSRSCIRAATVAAGLERTLELPGGAEVERRMRSVPGVGVWTAAETAQRSHGDPDAVSVGDYHVHDVVGYALTGEPADDERMLELLAPWAGHRQRVVRLIYASGFRKPRFGPRITIQDHRAH
jgi:3-methyladenine DNA glycosylase/8-oxoguanine DNA glycosylase